MVILVSLISVAKQSLHFECPQLKWWIMSKRQTIQKQKSLQKSNEMTVVLVVAGKNLRTVTVVKKNYSLSSVPFLYLVVRSEGLALLIALESRWVCVAIKCANV